MNIEVRAMACCGLRELHGLQFYPRSVGTAMKDVAKKLTTPTYPGDYRYNRFRFLVFTAAGADSTKSHVQPYGENFAKLIEKHKLGNVVESAQDKNPNTENQVKVWVWQIDWPAFNKYAAKILTVKEARKPVQAGDI